MILSRLLTRMLVFRVSFDMSNSFNRVSICSACSMASLPAPTSSSRDRASKKDVDEMDGVSFQRGDFTAIVVGLIGSGAVGVWIDPPDWISGGLGDLSGAVSMGIELWLGLGGISSELWACSWPELSSIVGFTSLATKNLHSLACVLAH